MSVLISIRVRVGLVSALLIATFAAAGCGGSTHAATKTTKASASTRSAPRDYLGKTSQGLPISFTVTPTSVDSIRFVWKATCADGQKRSNAIVFRSAAITAGAFSASGKLDTGAASAISGHVSGRTASGRLSRSGPSAFGTTCRDSGVTWTARAVG